MLLAGVTLGYFISQQFENEVKTNFRKFHNDARDTLNKLQNLYKLDSSTLASNANLIASLNLITEYATINDYKNIIFDNEKWRLASQLTAFAHAAHFDHAYILDRNGRLVCYTDNELGENGKPNNEEGILSFKNAKPVFITKSIDDKTSNYTPKDKSWLALSTPRKITTKNVIQYTKNLDTDFYLGTVSPIFRTLPDGKKILLGNLYLGKELDTNFFKQIAADRNFKIQLIYADDIKNHQATSPIPVARLKNAAKLLHTAHHEDSITLTTSNAYIATHSISLKGGNIIYIFSSIDRNIVMKKIHDEQWLIFSIFMISSLVVLIIGIFFFRRNITQPMDKLIEYAKQLSSGNYQQKAIHTGIREFDTLSNTLEKAATTINTRKEELLSANNEMEARVVQRTAELSKTNKELAEEITFRENIEERLRESRQMLKTIMDNIPSFIFWKDKESRYLGCNQNFLNASGYKSELDLIGKTDHDMPWTTEEADFYIECDKRVMESDTPEFHIQETQTTTDGNTIYADTNKIPLHDQHGNVIGILGTYEDITERKKAELNIIQAKEIAETANRAKSDFLSRMSHELRTPLNAILGFAQLLEYDISHPLDTEQKLSVNEILTAGNHLLELINDILDLSKIESGAMPLSIQPTILQQLLDDCIGFVKNYALQNNIEITLTNSNDPDLLVLVDPIRLKQILLNLLSNAIKFNHTDGKVTLSIEPAENRTVKISITDTGYGISTQHQERIFTPFDRLGADARAIDGTGIGLVIAKQLIELMHGEIGFTSKSGIGTTFWLTLPMPEAGAVVTDTHNDSNPNIIAAELADGAPRTIFCVEDNEANLRLIESSIQTKTPYQVVSAINAEEAIKLIPHIKPDLILMDITLPGMNGIEATRILKQNTDLKHIPVIAVTANAMLDDIRKGLNSGFSDYLTKPLDIALLLSTLQKYLD